MRRIVVALLLAAIPPTATADPGPPGPGERRVLTRRLPSPIVIDGAIDDDAWQAAPACSAFVQRDPVEGATPSQRTVVRVLYDDDALYVAARLHDSAPDSVVSELSRRDAGTRSDKFYVYLDPYRDRRSGYYFAVNAAGTQFDGTLFNDAWEDNSWDGVWQGRARRDAHGWTAEMRIPFSQLRFAEADAQTWGINFQRQMGRGFEDCYFVNRPKKQSGFVSLFPPLEGLSGVRPTNAIEVIPYATSKAEFLRHEPLDPFNDGSRYFGNVGGDLRMPIGRTLTLNGTVNPDFGQVEVDPAVVNLSDVETFFPEKRPFFVEGSSIFDTGQQGASDYWGFQFQDPTFFYTRRIGHAPEGSVPNAAYADVPDGTTILGAGKLSGKLSPSLNFGTMHALTAREMSKNQRADLSQFDSEVEPLAYYGVARVLKEFPERRHGLGLLTTVVSRDLHDAALRDQFNREAFAGVVDGWHFLDSGKTWVLSGYAAGSAVTGTAARIENIQRSSRHYYQRPDAEYTTLDPSRTSLSGGAARMWLNKEKGNVVSNSAIGFLSPGFEINDLGFLSRADVINAHSAVGYRWTEPTKHVRKHDAYAAVFGSTNFDGDLTGAGIWGRGFWWYTNNWTANVSSAYNPEVVDPRRSRGGPLMLQAPGYELDLFFDTDGSRKRYYNGGWYHYLQPEENSYFHSVYGYFVYKPVANVRFEIGPEYESARDGAFFVRALDDPAATATYGRRYVFARLDQRTLSANIRISVSFTPTMSLQFYGQPLISSGRYSDLRELARPRSLEFTGPGAGAWTYDAGARAFDPDGAGPADPEVLDFNTKSVRGNAVFRWEYMPGSALFLVWTQQRNHDESSPHFDLGPSFRRVLSADSDNIFLAKVTYYLTR
jgi:hypothetical protein